MKTTLVFLALTAAVHAWQPAPDSMLTEWGAEVTPENAWGEYPRPNMERERWTCLNGLWDYAVTPKDKKEAPAKYDGKILVPFAIESALSGVKKPFTPNDALWYRRTLKVEPKPGMRYLLNFEAVDHETTVSVNGKQVGKHTGGNLPFSFDITGALKPGENTLALRVTDATNTEWQLHGKQVLDPKGIWYTPVSGIWQTVWLEEVPELYIAELKITPKIDGTVGIMLRPEGPLGGRVGTKVVISLDGQKVVEMTGAPSVGELKIPDPKLWSPDSPTLYDLEITFGEDKVKSYVGLRETTVVADAAGNLRLHLNGKECFHWGTLDQGWWPDGLLTPPSDEAMCSDVDYLKAAGFNMLRKHIKVEPRRYYYHCDKIGMLVWQDQVSSGTGGNKFKPSSPEWPRLAPNPPEATWPDDAHEQWMKELKGMMDSLHNHPCIVQWVPFNERWGQHRTMKVGKWTVDYDPTRQVNIASGGNWFPVGHIVDAHKYPHPGFPFEQGAGGRFDGFVKVMGEFGGHGFPVKGHLWNPNARNWGYGGLPKNKEEWIERYKTSIAKLAELRQQGIAAGIYTQTTDVEGEINGLISYDRKVRKLPAKVLAEIHREAGLSGGKPTAIPKTPPVKPAMPRAEIEAGLKSHDRALYIKEGWIRDPYIILGPDDYFYLTGTTPLPEDPREKIDPYNVGLGPKSVVGWKCNAWRSKDLIEWESLGTPFSLEDTLHYKRNPKKMNERGRDQWRLWAPELHWLGERWALVHCPKQVSSLALTSGPEVRGPWSHPMGLGLGERHDPSLFQDPATGTWWMLWGNTQMAPLSADFTGYTAEPVRIDPAGERTNTHGRTKSAIGHEGATMRKIGDKYVHLGTAWSTDEGRKGSYNLYYCTADKITGPYGPREFAGRFLGHGTPFQTRDGKWWCTAFFNANVPPLPRKGIEKRDLSENAQTINQRGTTIVPLEVKIGDDGDISIRAKDPAYATPGPDEVQKFGD